MISQHPETSQPLLKALGLEREPIPLEIASHLEPDCSERSQSTHRAASQQFSRPHKTMNTPQQVTFTGRIDGTESSLSLSPSLIATLTAYISDHPEIPDIGAWAIGALQSALVPIISAYPDATVIAAREALKDAQANVLAAVQASARLR